MAKKSRRERVSGRRRSEEHQSGFINTSYRMPDGMSLFQPKEGTYRLDFLTTPAGAGNPYWPEGKPSYERTFFVHRGIGAGESAYICLAKTMNKRCPICEDIAKMRRNGNGDKDALTPLLPKERQLFLVYDHGDPEKGVQLWETSYHLFGKLLDKRIKTSDEDEGYEYFADPEDGHTLKIAFTEEARGGYKFVEASSIDFKKRGPIADEITEQVNGIILDDLLKPVTYDELEKIYLQLDDAPKKTSTRDDDDDDDEDDEDDDPPPKSKKKTKPPVEEDEEDDDPPPKKKKPVVDDDDDDDPPPKKKSKAKPVEEDEDEDEDDDPPPKKKGKAKPPVEDDDDEDEDDEDQPPPPKKNGKKPAVVEDDDEDDQDDDPPPRPKKGGKAAGSKKRVADDDDDDEIPF